MIGKSLACLFAGAALLFSAQLPSFRVAVVIPGGVPESESSAIISLGNALRFELKNVQPRCNCTVLLASPRNAVTPEPPLEVRLRAAGKDFVLSTIRYPYTMDYKNFRVMVGCITDATDNVCKRKQNRLTGGSL